MYSWIDYIVNLNGNLQDRFRLIYHTEEPRLDGVSKLSESTVGGVNVIKSTNDSVIYQAFIGEDFKEFTDSFSAFEWVKEQVHIAQRAA